MVRTKKTRLTPPPLTLGREVGIFSAAGVTTPQELAQGLNLLKHWGLNPFLAPGTLSRCRYLAGRDEERALALKNLLEQAIPCLWASRGGYGSLRLLPILEEILPPLSIKPFWMVGFSDISILLNFFSERFQLVTLHAPVISSLTKTSSRALEETRKILFGLKRENILYGHPWREGEAQGILIGGNLASLVSLVGTPWFPDLSGKILFLEEVNESPYRLDRLFNQLALSGELDKAKALVLGEFSGIEKDLLKELVREMFFGPILAEVPVGHGSENYPLLIGEETEISGFGKLGRLKQG